MARSSIKAMHPPRIPAYCHHRGIGQAYVKRPGKVTCLASMVQKLVVKLTVICSLSCLLIQTKSYDAGYGLIRFDKKSREVTFECWLRDVDVTQDNAEQFPGWLRTAIVK